jgi:hypothetical protein
MAHPIAGELDRRVAVRIARPIGEFKGSGAECTGLGVEGVSVELATPRMTKILMSHLVT